MTIVFTIVAGAAHFAIHEAQVERVEVVGRESSPNIRDTVFTLNNPVLGIKKARVTITKVSDQTRINEPVLHTLYFSKILDDGNVQYYGQYEAWVSKATIEHIQNALATA